MICIIRIILKRKISAIKFINQEFHLYYSYNFLLLLIYYTI